MTTTSGTTLPLPQLARRPLRTALAAFAVGGLLGTSVTLVVTDVIDDDGTADPAQVDEGPAPASEVSDTGQPTGRAMVSADALDRRAGVEASRRLAACRSSSMPADAVERCVAAR